MVRGSGFTMLQMGSVVLCLSLESSSSIASELRMTLKCVFSEGVMVNVFGSDLSFLLTLVDSGNSPQVHCMWASALSMLSVGFTISSESLLGDMGSDTSVVQGDQSPSEKG